MLYILLTQRPYSLARIERTEGPVGTRRGLLLFQRASGWVGVSTVSTTSMSASGAMRPLRVTDSGALSTAPLPVETITDWTEVGNVLVLTPLVPFTPFADAAEVLVFGLRVQGDSVDGARFIVDASEDGVLPAKSAHYEFDLVAGEHDVFETPRPLVRRYWRLAVQPANAGPAKVAFIVRRIPR